MTLLVAVCTQDNASIGTCATSADAVNWAYNNQLPINSNGSQKTWADVCFASTKGFVAITASSSDTYVTALSTDGLNWQPTVSGAQNNSWTAIAYAPSITTFCAVASSGTNQVMTSTDGLNWTVRTAAEANPWNDIAWSPSLSLFVAVAGSGTHQIMTSPDGITWTARTHAVTGAVAVGWDPVNAIFVIAGGVTNDQYSSDGITWTSGATSSLFFPACVVAKNGGGFVEGGGNGYVGQSSDGHTSWTAVTAGNPSSSTVHDIVYSANLGLYITAEAGGANSGSSTSSNLTSWTAQAGLNKSNTWVGLALDDSDTYTNNLSVTHTASNTFSTASSGTVAYQTVGTDNVVVFAISMEPNSPSTTVTVSSVTDTNGLTWTKKASLSFTQPSGPNTTNTQEVWWAHAPSAVSGTITVTLSGTVDDATLTTQSVAGCNNPAAPWDSNSSFPATATNASTSSVTPSATISTSAKNAMVLAFWGSPASGSQSNSLTGPLRVINSATTNGAINYSRNWVGNWIYDTTQTSVSVGFGTANSGWGLIVLALAGSASGGVWVSTDTPDTFSAGGYPGYYGVHGQFVSTEATDTISAVGLTSDLGMWRSTEAPDIFGATGRVVIQGPWASTEATDHMVATGVGFGQNGIWASTENPDIFAASGSTPITGVLASTEITDRFVALGAGVTRARRRRQLIVA